jgi:hypothetical protein
MWGASTSHNPKGLHGLLQRPFYLFKITLKEPRMESGITYNGKSIKRGERVAGGAGAKHQCCAGATETSACRGRETNFVHHRAKITDLADCYIQLGQRFSSYGPRITSGPRDLPLWSFRKMRYHTIAENLRVWILHKAIVFHFFSLY